MEKRGVSNRVLLYLVVIVFLLSMVNSVLVLQLRVPPAPQPSAASGASGLVKLYIGEPPVQSSSTSGRIELNVVKSEE